MPRTVNNFHITVEADGRKHPVTVAVRGKEGGFRIKVNIREDGAVSPRELDIYGHVFSNGVLQVTALGSVFGCNGQDVTLLKGRR